MRPYVRSTVGFYQRLFQGHLASLIAHDGSENGGSRTGPVKRRLNQILKAARAVGDGSWARSGRGREGVDRSEEKLAAELLWLGQKLSACGCGEEAVRRWASASNLARLALSAEARLQGSLVKVSGKLIFFRP
jgi:hypothetical protein